jgi:formylmethanofuran dehydrogenase subunit E
MDNQMLERPVQFTKTSQIALEPAVLSNLLSVSAARHDHLCPRQVLGVRIGLAGAAALDVKIPQSDKRLLVILETDGCFADGVEAATGCSVGHRTLRVEDYGKVAASFIDTRSERAVRVAPRLDVRQRANLYMPDEARRYFTQLGAYQVMPDEELLTIQEVRLLSSVKDLVSRPGVRVNCTLCSEEIINQREVTRYGMVLCLPCAGSSYYHSEKGNYTSEAPYLDERVYQVTLQV